MLHIAFNTDSAYTRFCGVTMVSLLRHNRQELVTFHILGRGLTPADKEALTILTDNFGQQICFYDTDPKLLEGMSINCSAGHISLTTYLRCFLAEALPATIDRVIYLDCDMLVLNSLKELWDTDIAGKALAAVEDMSCDEDERFERLCYPKSESYFNAGMLLVNLQYWREHQVGKECQDYYHRHPERIRFNDQDLLNAVLHGQWVKLSAKWNVQEGFYRPAFAENEQWKAAHPDLLTHPSILHFTNRKPWDYDSLHPLRHLFFDYQAFTPWCRMHPLHNPLLCLARFFRHLPYYLHLRKPKYSTLPAEGVAARC